MVKMNTKISILILYTILITSTVNSITINNDGGYNIVVTVHPNSPVPTDNAADYFYEIWDILELFSEQLFAATNGTFFLKRVDVLVPGHWAVGVSDSTVESLETADIRLTDSITSTPRAENANRCGLPGDYIQLPNGFFNQTMPQRFGHPSKALLNLWGRLRYGVWEEHGMPGSKHTPYFYKNYSIDGATWEATGCSDTKLEGTPVSIDGTPCENNDETMPPGDCRFKPFQTNVATTSLMGFHWLPSVTQFCNEANHNKGAPNRQNILCNYQSMWSVIEGSHDFASVTQKVMEIPPMLFNIVKQRQQPNLYILIDSGSFIDNEESALIFPEVIKRLSAFLSQDSLEGTLVSVGSYPSGVEGEPELRKLISWLPLDGSENLDMISKAILSVPTNQQHGRDYGRAIQEVVNEIARLNPAFQTALVVLKSGAAIHSWGSSYIEEEILSSLLKYRITLNAVELEMGRPNINFPRNLLTLAQRSGGVHVPLKTYEQVVAGLNVLLQNVTTFLQSRSPMQSSEYVLYKDFLDEKKEISIPFRPGMEKGLQIHLAVQIPLNSSPPRLSWTGGVGTVTGRFEWGQDGVLGHPGRHVFSVKPTLTFDPANPITEFKFMYTCPNCYYFHNHKLLITHSHANASNSLIPAVVHDGIVASVSISSPTNLIDLSQARPTDVAPFVIYAKIHRNGVPVKNLDVTAHVYFTGCCLPSDKIKLMDDGFASPDTTVHDGVYSGIYVPWSNYTYRISVMIQYKKTQGIRLTSPSTRTQVPLSGTTLLPEDQIISHQPEAIELEYSYSKSVEYPDEVTFKNNPPGYALLGKPYKIIDLIAQYNKTVNEGQSPIKITFTTPGIIWRAENHSNRVTRYTVFSAKSVENILRGNDVLIALDVPATKYSAGEQEVLFITDPNPMHKYYRVRALRNTNYWEDSNIVQVLPAEPLVETTTETSHSHAMKGQSIFLETWIIFIIAFIISQS